MWRQVARARLSKGVRAAIRQVADEWRIQRLHRASVRKAAQISTGQPLRVNLASGHHPKADWINVDLFAPHADLRLDLRERLPFRDNSIAEIYCEHFFEHLEYPNVADPVAWMLETPQSPSEALAFLRECRRVLTPAGVLDIVVPDAEVIIGEYVNRHQPGFSVPAWWGPAWCDTELHRVNYLFRQGREHKYAYDYETLRRVIESAGFARVDRRSFDPARDAENHRIGSLFVLSRKH